MSDFARLEEKLAKLRADESVGRAGRRLRGRGDALLAAILTEMGETILPRRLSFRAKDKAVHFAVSNRRCQAILAPVDPVEGAAAGDYADKPIPDAEDAAVPIIRDYLKRYFDGDSELTVLSSRIRGPGYPSDVGVPVPQLARAWEVDAGASDDRAPDEVMKDFLDGLEGLANGWLNIVGEEVVAQGGPEEGHAALGEHAAVFLDGYFGKFEQLYGEEGGAVLTAILASDAEGTAAIFAEVGEQSAFVEAPVGSVTAIAALWNRIIA